MDGTTSRDNRRGGTTVRPAANRRAAYRVEPADIEDIDLAMLSRRQRIVATRVADVAVGGASMHVATGGTTVPSDGEEVSVALNSRRHGYDAELPARVVQTREAAGGHVVHLSFLGSTVDLADPPPAMFELLNRRASYRGVGPGVCGDLQALATPRHGQSAGRSYPVTVRNISNTGISLELDGATHAAFEEQSSLRLTLELPGSVEPTRMACRICYRSRQGEGDDATCVYGCEYDWSETSDSLGVVEDLVTYILGAGGDE